MFSVAGVDDAPGPFSANVKHFLQSFPPNAYTVARATCEFGPLTVLMSSHHTRRLGKSKKTKILTLLRGHGRLYQCCVLWQWPPTAASPWRARALLVLALMHVMQRLTLTSKTQSDTHTHKNSWLIWLPFL
jgi:hypothetical protein